MDYEHILGATDFSEIGDIALRRAAEFATAAGAKLTVVHVLPQPEAPGPFFAHYEVKSDRGRVERARQEALAALVERVPEAARQSGIEISYEVPVGDPTDEILRLDVQRSPDLIVIATNGRRGMSHWLMGSVAERIVQMARADVLTVREHGLNRA